MIYPADSVIQSSNNCDQVYQQLKPVFPCWKIGNDDDDDDYDNDDLYFPYIIMGVFYECYYATLTPHVLFTVIMMIEFWMPNALHFH